MKNKTEYWKDLSTRIKSPVDTKNKKPDTTEMEIDFIKDYIKPTDEVLDLGSGSGLIVNQLYDKVKHIIAVEKFEGFSRFIVDEPNILVINSDLTDFKIRKKFDIILCTGVSQCFKNEDMRPIFKNISDMLKDDGTFISRSHCGLQETVTIDKFSEELNADYFAEFTYLETEIDSMKEAGFNSVEIFDNLPDSLNKWENTRHFYFICKK